jgi:hypothetical protein
MSTDLSVGDEGFERGVPVQRQQAAGLGVLGVVLLSAPDRAGARPGRD